MISLSLEYQLKAERQETMGNWSKAAEFWKMASDHADQINKSLYFLNKMAYCQEKAAGGKHGSSL